MSKRVPKKTTPSPKLTEYVRGIVTKYQSYVNAESGLTSLLYDVDLLPEQLLHVLDVNPPAAGPNASRMAVICELWKRVPPGAWEKDA